MVSRNYPKNYYCPVILPEYMKWEGTIDENTYEVSFVNSILKYKLSGENRAYLIVFLCKRHIYIIIPEKIILYNGL